MCFNDSLDRRSLFGIGEHLRTLDMWRLGWEWEVFNDRGIVLKRILLASFFQER